MTGVQTCALPIFDIYSHAIHVDRLIFGGGLVQIYPSKDSLSHRQPVLRRIPDADDPRVLRRAVENASVQYVQDACAYEDEEAELAMIRKFKERIVEEARRELESEGSDET